MTVPNFMTKAEDTLETAETTGTSRVPVAKDPTGPRQSNMAVVVGGIWLISRIVAFMAPRFESETDEGKAFQVAVYGYTPYLAFGVFHLIPRLDALVILGGLYSFYQIYLGLPIVMNTPKEKALPFAIATIVAMILVYFIIGAVSSLIFNPVLV